MCAFRRLRWGQCPFLQDDARTMTMLLHNMMQHYRNQPIQGNCVQPVWHVLCSSQGFITVPHLQRT